MPAAMMNAVTSGRGEKGVRRFRAPGGAGPELRVEFGSAEVCLESEIFRKKVVPFGAGRQSTCIEAECGRVSQSIIGQFGVKIMKTVRMLSILLGAAVCGCADRTLNPTASIPPIVQGNNSAEQSRLSPSEAWDKIRQGALVIDVRSADEYASGHLDQAINVPHTEIGRNGDEISPDHEREIVVYCKSGRRAGAAQQELLAAGYRHVYNAGGYSDLAAAQAPVTDD